MKTLEQRCKKEIREFVKSQNHDVRSVSHVHPRCYVVGKFGDSQIFVAYPWADSDDCNRDFDRQIRTHITLSRTGSLKEFPQGVQVGDWLSVGYVRTKWGGVNVAVEVVV